MVYFEMSREKICYQFNCSTLHTSLPCLLSTIIRHNIGMICRFNGKKVNSCSLREGKIFLCGENGVCFYIRCMY